MDQPAKPAKTRESAAVASLIPQDVLDQLQGITLGTRTLSFLSESLTVAATLEVSIASVKEAARTLAWLETSHPDWWPSAITDTDMRRDVRLTALAREGSRAVAHARLAVSSYDAFLSSTRGISPDSGLDVDVLLLYLHDVTSTAKNRMETRGRQFKGSAANARLKGLKSAVALFKAPFDMENLQSRFTASAVSRPEAPGVEVTSKHISAEAVAALEDIALGKFYESVRRHPPPPELPRGPAAVEAARCMVLAALACLRLDDLRKTKVTEVGSEAFSIEIQGPKCKKHSRRKIVAALVPFRGVTPGMDVWAPEWARSKIGQSFVFEGFSPKNAGVLEATSLSGELIRASDTTPALRALVGAALGVEVDALKTSGLTGHSLRHFLPEVATAAMWPDHLIDPLGRWASKANQDGSRPRTASRSAAAAYSAGSTAQQLEMRLRKKAIALVTDFIGTNSWRDRLPVQRAGLISFDFISEAQENDDDFSQFEALTEAKSFSDAASRPPAVPRKKRTQGTKGSQQLAQQRPTRAGRAGSKGDQAQNGPPTP